MKNWKRTFGQKLSHMTVEQARDFVARRQGVLPIGDEEIKSLTGGYSCQAINFHVCRAIGLKATGK